MDDKQPIKRVEIPSPEWDATASSVRRAMRLTSELNKLSYDDGDRVRAIFSELIGRPVDETFSLIPPFYTAGGRDIRVGRKVFINQCCTIYDLGGVEIGDLVMIGPNVNIITAAHPLDPSRRRATEGRPAYVEGKPIVIGKNVWIATAATILGGVTIGENSVVGAGAVVTKDVPANTFVAGVPARVIRSVTEDPAEGWSAPPQP